MISSSNDIPINYTKYSVTIPFPPKRSDPSFFDTPSTLVEITDWFHVTNASDFTRLSLPMELPMPSTEENCDTGKYTWLTII